MEKIKTKKCEICSEEKPIDKFQNGTSVCVACYHRERRARLKARRENCMSIQNLIDSGFVVLSREEYDKLVEQSKKIKR